MYLRMCFTVFILQHTSKTNPPPSRGVLFSMPAPSADGMSTNLTDPIILDVTQDARPDASPKLSVSVTFGPLRISREFKGW
jgi:hypothetical protein